MLVQLPSKEGLSETAMEARKRPFMTAVAIVSNLKIPPFCSLAPSSQIGLTCQNPLKPPSIILELINLKCEGSYKCVCLTFAQFLFIL